MSEKRKRQEETMELDIEGIEDIEGVDKDGSSSNSSLKDKGSDVWNHFDKFKDNEGILRAKCRHCDKGVYNMSGSNNSTGNLIKHLKVHPDKTKSSIKKQAHFMVKFLNDNSSQIVSIYKLIFFIYWRIKFTYLNIFIGIF